MCNIHLPVNGFPSVELVGSYFEFLLYTDDLHSVILPVNQHNE